MADTRLSRDEFITFPRMYLFYKNNPEIAVRDILGIKLPPHQRLDLKLQWHSSASDIIRVFSRGMSKTFGEALLDVLTAVLVPGIRIIALGAEGFRQGKLILEECERIIRCDLDGQDQSGFVANMIDYGGRRSFGSVIKKDPDLWKIPFLNRSQIATAPLGANQGGEAIRGFRAHITQIDERKSLEKAVKDQVIRPFSIVGLNVVSEIQEFQNRNIDSGTLQYESDDFTQEYQEYLRLIREGSEDYLVIKFCYADAFDIAAEDEKHKYNSQYFNNKLKFWSVPYNIRVDEIERELSKLTVDMDSWKAEYLCEAMSSTGDYYPFPLMQSVSRKKVIDDFDPNDPSSINKILEDNTVLQYLHPKLSCEDPCILGVDTAREHDLCAFTVLRLGQLSKKAWNPILQEGKTRYSNIIWSYMEQGMRDPEIALLIYKLLGMFNVVGVALDQRGGGSSVRDQLYYVVQEKKVDAQVLYDPNDNDEHGIATLLRGKMGTMESQNNRLRLVHYTDEENTMVNRSLRTAMLEEKFYFSGGTEKVPEELQAIQAFINVAPKQFRMIQTEPTRNWLRFVTPNPDLYYKDLFSATVYAWGEAMKFLVEENKPKPIPASIAPTFNLKLKGH